MKRVELRQDATFQISRQELEVLMGLLIRTFDSRNHLDCIPTGDVEILNELMCEFSSVLDAMGVRFQ